MSVQAETDRFADVTDYDESCLTSGVSGSARILWAEPGTGQKRAIVLLGAANNLPVGENQNDMLYWDATEKKWVILDAPAATGSFALMVVDGELCWTETEEFTCP